MTKLLPILALPLLTGCPIIVVAAAIGMIAASQNMDPITIQDGVAWRDYDVSYDRCWAAVESSVRSLTPDVQPPATGELSNTILAKLPDGRPVEVRASRRDLQTRVEVRVGAEDTEANRETAREIHAKIDADFDIVRRHYPKEFGPVWDASQKTGLEVRKKIQPDDRLGRIAAAMKDGTSVVITLQKIDDARTRVTIEVGTTPTEESKKEALQLAETISKELGVAAEEDQPADQ